MTDVVLLTIKHERGTSDGQSSAVESLLSQLTSACFKGQMRDVLCTIICFIHCAVEALAQLTRACLSDKAALLLQKANTEGS